MRVSISQRSFVYAAIVGEFSSAVCLRCEVIVSDRIRFDGVLEPLAWGKNTYAIVRVPAELVEAAKRWPTRRIDGSIDGLSLNLGLNKADADVMPGSFVYVGAGLQRRLGVHIGDLLSCEFEPADPDLVPVPKTSRRQWRTHSAQRPGSASAPANGANC